MAIHFDDARWEKTVRNYQDWWDHKLDRPLVASRIATLDPGRPEPAAPFLTQENALDLTLDPDALIDRIDYELSKLDFLGDDFPFYNMDCFGPGVLAAFLGATPSVSSTGNIWFSVPEIRELCDLHFTYQPDNIWFNRVKEIYRAAGRRWHGKVVMGMVDMGGILDVLASFRGTDNLLMDLYDEPEEVSRLVTELHDLWIRYYNELNDVIAEGGQKLYCNWSRILSPRTAYVPQCDFCYMISPDMFNEFVRDELAMYPEQIEDVIYHLDGPGELNHLDSLLTIEKLKAVQWIPGDGSPTWRNWPEVYCKIHDAGKLIQVFGADYDEFEEVSSQFGSAKGMILTSFTNSENTDRAYHIEWMRRLGLDVE